MATEDAQPSSPPSVVVIPPGAGRSLAAFGSTTVFKLEGHHTGRTLCLAVGHTAPGAGPPPHVHRCDDEVFFVLEGELSFLAGADWVPAPPGTVVYAPRGAPHTFRNVGSTPSRHLVMTLPSGFDEFYIRCAELFAGGGAPDQQQLRAVAAEYGYEFLTRGSSGPDSGRLPGEGTA